MRYEQYRLNSGVHQITTLTPCEHAGLGPFYKQTEVLLAKGECNMNQLQDLTLRYCTRVREEVRMFTSFCRHLLMCGRPFGTN